jgi:hypothetical protein
MNPAERNTDLVRYFEYSGAGISVEEDGLKTVTFGEFLVELGAVDRYQLLQALQEQDRQPGSRLGDCIAALGFLAHRDIEDLHQRYRGVEEVLG